MKKFITHTHTHAHTHKHTHTPTRRVRGPQQEDRFAVPNPAAIGTIYVLAASLMHTLRFMQFSLTLADPLAALDPTSAEYKESVACVCVCESCSTPVIVCVY